MKIYCSHCGAGASYSMQKPKFCGSCGKTYLASQASNIKKTTQNEPAVASTDEEDDDVETPTPTPQKEATTDSPEDDSSQNVWIPITAAAGALLFLAFSRLLLLAYLRNRNPVLSHIAISEFAENIDDASELFENSSIMDSQAFELPSDAEIDFLSDEPGITDIKFTLRTDSGDIQLGSLTASYSDTKNIPSHTLELDALPDVIRISGVVSEIIWTINAKKPLGTRFSLELQVAEDWVAIEEIGEETVQIEPSVEMNFQARLVAISPFRTRRTSINAPIGVIDLEGSGSEVSPE